MPYSAAQALIEQWTGPSLPEELLPVPLDIQPRSLPALPDGNQQAVSASATLIASQAASSEASIPPLLALPKGKRPVLRSILAHDLYGVESGGCDSPVRRIQHPSFSQSEQRVLSGFNAHTSGEGRAGPSRMSDRVPARLQELKTALSLKVSQLQRPFRASRHSHHDEHGECESPESQLVDLSAPSTAAWRALPTMTSYMNPLAAEEAASSPHAGMYCPIHEPVYLPVVGRWG